MFMWTETVTVPTDQLIANLEKRLASKPMESDRIQSGEQIKIWTRKQKHLDGIYAVDEKGMINLPRIGTLEVSGKTLLEVRDELNNGVYPGAPGGQGIFVEQSWGQRRGRLMPGELAEFHYELARLHAMSYSRKIGEFQSLIGGDRPFFGPEPDNRFAPDFQRHRNLGGIPLFQRRPQERPEQEEARKHLAAAIEKYREALKLKEDHLPARLGLGWCLDQAGDKTAAVESYRKLLALAWKKERNAKHVFYGSFVEETAHYLLPLLDSKRDSQEIAEIKGYTETMLKKGRAITPLMVPLEDDVKLAELVDCEAGVQFDLDGSGFKRRWGWITPKAAWLVWDPRRGGKITSGLQMFGSVTFWIFWKNGYEALSALDDNGDGALSGRELHGLALWHDRNSNGVSEPGEVRTVESWDIQSLSCHYGSHPTGIVFSPRGVVFQRGQARPTYDWIAPSR